MGKYSEVIKGLKPLATPRSKRVEKLRTEIQIRSAVELARTYAMLRKKKDEVEATLSEVNETLEAISSLLVPAFIDEGVTSLRILETGQSVSVQFEPYAAVIDKDAHRRWAIANGLENSLALPWMTTNALTKERLLNGEPEPAGVQAFVATKLVLRQK
jgi:hypothetical protein